MEFNQVVEGLPPYPMEELNRIKRGLVEGGAKIFDFGTGDPRIPTWEPIKEAVRDAIPAVSQYPTIRGGDGLRDGIWSYLEGRFGLCREESGLDILTSNGSKEAVFHTALCVVGSGGRRRVLYPDPGYPVYKSGTLFAGGIPTPMELLAGESYLMKPWLLPSERQKETCAIWVNYPHNPTGAIASDSYYKELLAWSKEQGVFVLSDECYVDIYDEKKEPPLSLSTYGSENVFSFMSLSKRSGITGYRSGFIIGPKKLIAKLARARANFGVGTPVSIQAGAKVAWQDEGHVAKRRRLFTERIDYMVPKLKALGLLEKEPSASFYLWCKIPDKWSLDDIAFSLALAQKGVITTPSSWLSEGVKGYIRFAMAPDISELPEAIKIIESFLSS